MIKDIIIPVKAQDKINLQDIDENAPGLILVYKESKLSGYINYNSTLESWKYNCDIDDSGFFYETDTLKELIDLMLATNSYTFKFLEFE